MDAWLWLRVGKWVGVMLFASGLWLGVSDAALQSRRDGVYGAASLGFFLSWVCGWGLLRQQGGSMGAPFVSLGMVGSVVALGAAVWAVEIDGRPMRWVRGVVAGAVAVVTAAMVFRGVLA
jgi:hypothetical protein